MNPPTVTRAWVNCLITFFSVRVGLGKLGQQGRLLLFSETLAVVYAGHEVTREVETEANGRGVILDVVELLDLSVEPGPAGRY
tara:strand:+ start:273 stop:521 length:249 start_codon:yes stop_codon:yes gene_type:complete